jgi:hypothetical protein
MVLEQMTRIQVILLVIERFEELLARRELFFDSLDSIN